ncbi:Ig-like domain-containing protein [Burkholderia cenocepacia]|uniref:Ig-like domain-containing protein n=1 Tax=Burkholderia cenocepacia TaxID=95486 RepID=UPI002650EDA9|nr:Ig-like domain-containing protein [Burkholderia cenocepacia]MDN7452300.1 Ig-like domain-containing protein [Burkholderia cenocepacia]
MSTGAIKLAILNGKKIAQSVELKAGQSGALQTVQAVSQGKYLLIDEATGRAPEHLVVKRVGNDLYLGVDNVDPPQLVVENYHGSGGEFVGQESDGQFYKYVASDAAGTHEIAALTDNTASPVVLRHNDALPGFGALLADASAGLTPTEMAMIGLGVAAAAIPVAVFASGGGNDGARASDEGVHASDAGPQPAMPRLNGINDMSGRVTGLIRAGSITDEHAPQVTGTGTPGNTVVVYDNGSAIGSATIGSDGAWAFQPAAPLVNGKHAIAVAEVDGQGQQSATTPSFEFEVDDRSPASPALRGVFDPGSGAQIENNGYTDGTRPVFKGAGDTPGNTVEIWHGQSKVGEAVVGSDGTWTIEPGDALASGHYDFEIVEVDPVGRVSASTDFTMTIDTSPPSRPLLDRVIDDVGEHIGIINRKGLTNDGEPTLEGRGKIGTTIYIYDNGGSEPIGSTVIGDSGTWSVSLSTPLADGVHQFAAVSVDRLDRHSAPSRVYEVTVDTTPPAQPTIDAAHDDVGAIQGQLANHGVTDDARPTLGGSAEADAIVTIRDGDKVLGSTVADAGGKWVFTPSQALADGEHTLTIVAEDRAGNTSVPSEAFTISVDKVPPDAPSIASVTDNVGDKTGALKPNDKTDDARPVLQGTAEKDATVLVYDTVFGQKVLIGSTQADADGNWTFRPEAALPEGDHALTAVAQDAAGNQSKPTEGFDFTVLVGGVPAAPAITGVFDAVEPNVGNVAQQGHTNDARPTVTGTAPAGQVVHVSIDGKEVGTTTSNENGRWWFRPETALADGEHAISAVAESAAGNLSAPTGDYTIVVDTVAPAASKDESLQDDVGDTTGAIANGSTTDDSTPTLSGHAEPGATVTIHDGDKVIGSTTVNDDGSWHFRPTQPLEDGEHSLSTTVTDPAGNTSASSPSIDFTVDTSAVAIAIDQVIDHVGTVQGALQPGQSTDDRQPEITGKATPNSVVKIYVDGNLAGATQAGADGQWSLKLSSALSEGKHAITATVTTAADGESKPTAAFELTIDTTAPNQPTIDTVGDDVGADRNPVAHGGSTDDTTPTLKGTAEAGSVVTIRDGDTVLGSVAADADGKWTFTPATPLQDGSHDFTAVAKDAAGNVSAPSDAFQVQINTSEPGAPTIEQVVDNVGDKTGALQPHDKTDDAQPVVNGTAAKNSTVLIYDTVFGQKVLIGSTQADADGNWTFRPSAALPEGDHALTAVAQDAAGNLSEPTAGFDFTVLVGGVPAAPAITGVFDAVEPNVGNVTQHGMTNDARPTVTGTATAGEIVHVSLDGKEVGTTTSDENGRWWFRPETALADGEHAISAIAESETGNLSPKTGDYAIVVDTVAPAASIDESLHDDVGDSTGAIANGSTTDDSTPTLSGHAEPGATVTIHDGDKVIGSTTVNDDGSWHFRPTQPLEDGEHSLSTTVTDPAGNTSASSPSIDFTVDTGAVTIAIDEVIDHVGTIQGALQPGQTTDDRQPQVTGKATPNGLVMVYVDGNLAGAAQVGANGQWSVKLSNPLTEGKHEITARVTVAGNESKPTAAFELTVDTTAPNPPTIDAVHDDVGSGQAAIVNGGATDDTTPTLTGNAEAGSVVTIRDGDKVLGSTMADADGKWTFTPATPLTDGAHDLTAVAQDAAGNVSQPSDGFTVNVDTSGRPSTVITGVIDDTAPQTGVVANGGATNDVRPTLNGIAKPGSIVTIRDGDKVLGSTTADQAGNWHFRPEQDLSEGTHVLTAVSKDASGEEGIPSQAYEVNVDTVAPDAPSITEVTDSVGEATGALKPNDKTDDARPTVQGTAEKNSTVLIYDAQFGQKQLLGSARADADGHWTFRPDVPLLEGGHTLTAVAQDAAGNQSEPGEGFDFSVVVGGAPAAPSITGVFDAVEPNVGNVAQHGVTNDTRPTVTGAAPAGQVVHVSIDGKEVGTATADEDGRWTFRPETALADGEHAISAVAESAAGNLSAPTGDYTIVVDTVAPAASKDESLQDDVGDTTGAIANGSTTDDSTPTLSGHAEPGATVTIHDGDKVIGSTTVNDDGSWHFRPTQPLEDGEHSLSTTVTDPAGNTSASSPSIDFTVDTSAVTIAIDQVIDHVGTVQGALQPGQTTDDRQPGIAGKATPNATVKVYVDGEVAATVRSDANGQWSLKLPVPLSEGKHAITATATPAGAAESAPTAAFELTVDTTAPNPPTIDAAHDDVGAHQSSIANGGATDDATPTLTGTAEPGSTVTIHDGDAVLGSVTADADGKWTFTPATPLTDGEHEITAVAQDAAGNVSAPSLGMTVIIDTSLPKTPTIAEVVDNVGDVTGALQPHDKTDDAQPVVNGTAGKNSTVLIYDTVFGQKVLIGSTQADADGNWTFRPEAPVAPLADGDHSLTAVAQNAAGNQSEPTEGFDFTVLVGGVPTAPAITGVFDAVEPNVGNVAQHGMTNDARPTVTGTATAGEIVHVSIDGKEVGTTTSDENGRWWFRPETALADGEHAISAIAESETGNLSPKTGDYAIVVDTVAPAASIEESLHDDVGDSTGAIANGSTTDDSTPTLSGHAEPGATVTIHDGDKVIGSTTVNDDGSWHFRPTQPLEDGEHSLSTTVTDPAGNTSANSPSIDFTVDTSAVTIAIDEVIDHVGTIQGALQPGRSTDDSRPEITGTATPDALVKVYVDGKVAGSVQSDASGKWSLALSDALSEGKHAITATATPAGAAESAPTAAFELTIDTTAPGKPTIDAVHDDVGGHQVPIVNGGFTDDTTPTLTGKAEAGSVVRIHDGDVVLGSAVADANGQWSFTPAGRLPDGEHALTAVAQDAAGNASQPSDAFTVTIDTTAPDAPSLTMIVDDVGPILGDVINTAVSDDSMPQLVGRAEPNALVTVTAVYEGESMVLGSVQASASGDWSLVPAEDLDDGKYSITISATDRVGNVSVSSDPFVLEIDTTPPMPPTVKDVLQVVEGATGSLGANGGTTADARPQIVGTAEGNALIMVFADRIGVLGSVFADATGNWTFQPDAALTDGTYVISVTAMDAAGNPSGASGRLTLVIEGGHAATFGLDAADHAPVDVVPVPDADSHQPQARSLADPAHHAAADDSVSRQAHDAAADPLATAHGPATESAPHAQPDAASLGDVHAHVEAAGSLNVLVMDGEGEVLDLSKLTGFSAHAAIDAVDLTGAGANTLKVSLGDVLHFGEQDLFVEDGRTQLMVKGDAHDVVDLSGMAGTHGSDWVAHGDTVVDGVAYTVYENSTQNAELLVQHGVTTHLM